MLKKRRKTSDRRNWENCPIDGTKLHKNVCKKCGFSYPEWWEAEPKEQLRRDGRIITRLEEEESTNA